jgi:ATP-dependent DNA helicase DinG
MDLDAALTSLPGLAPRVAQRDMARAVATAIERDAPLLVHAPTGVGKSLGYLIPIVTAGRRAIVATATKALQSQLVERDLPRLGAAFDTTFALVMGRGNYLCRAKADALVAATQLAATAQEEAALDLVEWGFETDTGSRLDAPPGTRDDVWDLVSTSGEDCPGQKGCSFFGRCFAERAREHAREVDVVVTNHHLLLLELELRQLAESPGVMLPEVDVLVVDEAHRLADHAADLYGVTVTGARVSRAGAAADAVVKAAGGTSDWARRLRARWEQHASTLRPGSVLPGSRPARELALALEPVAREAQAAARALREVATLPEDLEGGMHAARRRLAGLRRDLGRLAQVGGTDRAGPTGDPADEPPADLPASAVAQRPGAGRGPRVGVDAEPVADHGPGADGGPGVADRPGADGEPLEADGGARPTGPADADLAVWVEERRDGGRAIRSALVEPGPVLGELLWGQLPVVVVACSATLAVAGSLDAAAGALGVGDAAELVAESPFDFRHNALLYVPRRMPFPTGEGFQQAAERELRALVEASQGRALVLCTSWRAVESFAAAMADMEYELLVQGDDTPARLAARFRDQVASVLVATRTFFEGVDVPGQALSLLVLDRLPFPRPDDPLLGERGRRIERRGGSKFSQVWLPSAAVSLQQALGRLIRSESDRGVMAVLDRRLADARYGRTLLASLPPAPLTRSLDDVARFFGTDLVGR